MNKISNRKPKKFLALIICLNLVVMMAVSGTLAYIFTSSNPVVNTFTPVSPGSSIVEKFENNVKRDVKVTNTGQVDSYIRAKVVITWQSEKKADGTGGDVYSTTPIPNEDYQISYGTDWIPSADGFWYYRYPVEAGASTNYLIGEARQIKECEDKNYMLHIEILSQAIQSTPSTAVVEVWQTDTNKLTVNVDGTLSVVEKSQDTTQSD